MWDSDVKTVTLVEFIGDRNIKNQANINVQGITIICKIFK